MSARESHVLCLSAGGFHRMAYRTHGAAEAARTVVCVHGLTRNAHDFDALAGALAAAGFQAVCPDVVGRGRSDWLPDAQGYGYPQYLADMTALIARLDVVELDWVGTSMGGLIGMMLAAQEKSPLRRLVLNDVGPFVPKAAVARIAAYLGTAQKFPDIAAADAHLRAIHAPFGALTDPQWRRLTETSVAALPEGGFRLHYDPRIGDAFTRAEPQDMDLWALWDRVACPVLVLRGAASDLLTADVAAEMARRGPRAEVIEVAGAGHAPALLNPWQIAQVRDWLVSVP